jgi:hypothetical protein
LRFGLGCEAPRKIGAVLFDVLPDTLHARVVDPRAKEINPRGAFLPDCAENLDRRRIRSRREIDPDGYRGGYLSRA